MARLENNFDYEIGLLEAKIDRINRQLDAMSMKYGEIADHLWRIEHPPHECTHCGKEHR